MDKRFPTPADAVRDVGNGASLAVGGFGVCGVPNALITALAATGVTDLETVSNNCGLEGYGLGLLLNKHRIRRTVSSYVGENSEFARQYFDGELEVELCPQGTLAERLRAGGAGIPAFYTATGAGTQVADGGLPWRYATDGSVSVASPAKEVRRFGDQNYVLETGIVCDFSLVHAAKGDRRGNLTYAAAARNFNPICAAAGRITIAEVEQLVDPDDMDPAQIHTPGIFVQRVVEVGETGKLIEKLTTRPRTGA